MHAENEVAARHRAGGPRQLFRKLESCVISAPRAGGRLRWMVVAALAGLAHAALAQTASAAPAKKQPLDLVLRSIAVLEWNGSIQKPDASLLIPITVYTDDRYLDSADYLAQPVPFAVENHTQYVLQLGGVPQGYYDLTAAGHIRNVWFAAGKWDAAPAKPPVEAASADTHRGPATADESQPRLPRLHRRHPKAPKPDPNLPVMAYGALPARSLAAFSRAANAPRQQMVAVYDAATRNVHPLTYNWPDAAHRVALQEQVEALAVKLLQNELQTSDATQAAANSDAANSGQAAQGQQPDRSPHLVKRPPTPPTPPTPPASVISQTAPAPKPPTLANLDFRCFTLAYEASPSEDRPTCVLSTETPDGKKPKQYVTVIEQPDIYGAPQAISQSITDARQLKTHPRVHLVDAVDAAADHNAELLFEIDGASHRQFGLYQVADGHVKLVYITPKLPF